jgi:negative regulator of flagellin synthesis FlgM
MRIDPVNPAGALGKVGKTAPAEAKHTAALSDQVEISGDAQAIGKAIEAARAARIENPERVEALRRSVQSGTYTVDASRVAARILDAAVGSAPTDQK